MVTNIKIEKFHTMAKLAIPQGFLEVQWISSVFWRKARYWRRSARHQDTHPPYTILKTRPVYTHRREQVNKERQNLIFNARARWEKMNCELKIMNYEFNTFTWPHETFVPFVDKTFVLFVFFVFFVAKPPPSNKLPDFPSSLYFTARAHRVRALFSFAPYFSSKLKQGS